MARKKVTPPAEAPEVTPEVIEEEPVLLSIEEHLELIEMTLRVLKESLETLHSKVDFVQRIVLLED